MRDVSDQIRRRQRRQLAWTDTRAPRFNNRTARPPADAIAANPYLKQTNILPPHGMGVVVRAIVRLGVVPIVVALLVLVFAPGRLGRSL